MIAAAGATGKLGVGPRQLLQQGYKRLADSPELGKIADSLRGELLGAAKNAAMTAASSRIESLNSRLQDQAKLPGTGKRRQDDDEIEDAEYDEDEYDEEEPEDEAPARKRSSSNGKQARTGTTRSPVRRARR